MEKELLENAAMIFASENHSGKESSEEVDKLHVIRTTSFGHLIK